MNTLTTFSQFYYGFEVTTQNLYLNFKEGGGPELTAEVSVGSFSLEQMAVEIQKALNNEGALTYTVTVNRTTRKITIAASGTFSLLPVTGTLSTTSIFPLIGFTTDRTGGTSYLGNSAAGYAYVPQFRLQSYVPIEHWTGAALATVNKAASGRVEVIKFGNESFMQCNIQYINDRMESVDNFLKPSATGVADIIQFLTFAITKGPIEFMPDIDDASDFYDIILESTPDNKDGVGFKLNELYDKGLPGWYETGVLKFRQVEL